MGNMGYCRFENTYRDLKDCWEHWDDAKSESERKYQERLRALCYEIAEEAL